MSAPSIEAAHKMGAVGGPVVEAERLAFEAWMAGHCWALSATWRGNQYLSDAENGGDLDPRAIATRRLWAAWRDRAALTAPAMPAGWPWVSMKDRPPPPDCWLLVTWGDHNAVDKAHTYTKWKHKTNPLGYLIQGHHGSHNDVTAWMLLPTAAPQAPAPSGD